MEPANRKIIMDYGCTMERLARIAQAKRRFIDHDEDPRQNPNICPEVAESWIRSKNYGVNPYRKKQKSPDPETVNKALRDNKLLLEIAAPFARKFMPLLTISNYLLGLTDKLGTVLYQVADESTMKSISWSQQNLQFLSAAEEYIGTNAHYLSIIHKAPTQLIGPSNYLMAHEQHIASAAPILDSSGEVIGSLGVLQNYEGSGGFQNIFAHTLGWVISMAEAIANLYELQHKSLQLETAYKTLENSLSVAEQGFVTLDNRGMITHISKKAKDMLGIVDKDNTNRHYTAFFGTNHSIGDALLKGSNVHDLELAVGHGTQQRKYMINLDQIWDDEKKNRKGAVIYMTKLSRVDKMIGKRGGMKAYFTFNDIKSDSKAMQQAINFSKQVSSAGTNILLFGESGTGKELFAQAIHNSYCPDGPFIAVNCASLPRNLIESELFGYEGGAFTGADKKGRPGKFELANGGTLLLDEIGDMPIEIQPVLLRALEERQIVRIGGTKYVPVDVRIIAATNKDLIELIRKQQFREDLYFRLAVFKIHIPPLRERENDALLLANYFVETTCQKVGKRPLRLGQDACRIIRAYHWPGNVRQLENAIVHAVYMCQGETITANHLPPEITSMERHREDSDELVNIAELEKRAIIKAMRMTNNNTAMAAKRLGIGRTTLYKKLKDYDIKI